MPAVPDMSHRDRELYEIARRVIVARLASSPVTAVATTEAMQLSCGELYRILELTMGAVGLQALVARAIQIAAREYPWLASVKPGTAVDCMLPGLSDAAAHVDANEAMEGSVALLGTIVWLLTTFIGEDLTLRFVRHAWPKVSFSKLAEGMTNE
jgi:hypothetical protein